MSSWLIQIFTPDFITLGVIVCFILGILFSIQAGIRLRAERKELDEIVDNCQKVDEAWIRQTLLDSIDKLTGKRMGRNLALRRIQIMGETLYGVTLYDSSKKLDREPEPPHMNDLHNLTEQAISGSFAATGLRLIASVLLIIGICGTLSGVHDVLEKLSGAENASMGDFAPALEPSFCAVFFTIVLFGLRGWYLMAVDNFLYRLDRVTMVSWLPNLIPNGNLKATIMDFSKAVTSFQNDIKDNITPLKDSMEAVKASSERMQETIQSIKDSGSALEAEMGRISPACEQMVANQQDIETGVATLGAALVTAQGALSSLAELNQQLSSKVELYRLSMENLNTSIERERTSLQASTTTANMLSKQMENVRTSINNLGDFSNSANKLKDVVQNSEKEMAQTTQSLREAANNASTSLKASQAGINVLNSHFRSISDNSIALNDAAQKAQAAADKVSADAQSFEKKLTDYDTAIKTEARQLEVSREGLKEKVKAIHKELLNINKKAAEVEQKILKPGSFFAKAKELFGKSGSSPRKRGGSK